MSGMPFGRIFSNAALLEALSRSQAVIEFDLKGMILDANENFCKAMGYTLEEIIGKHHRIFIDPHEAVSKAYEDFWKRLTSGQYDQREYKRIAKGGREIWIQASYNPVFRGRKPFKIVKFATDITAAKQSAAEDRESSRPCRAPRPSSSSRRVAKS